jgi:two-component system chemotaxis response regulator CheY
MVADGVELTRVEIRNVLENNGFTVVACAKDGRQAVELYKEKHPALVTIDTHLPMLDGYQATQRIREYDPDAKVIVISRARDRAMVLEAIMSGASDYICKPVQPERLLRSVNRLLAS